ncbi:MAG: ribonuclease Z [Candidatus Anstonellaceae archaeon]
MQKLKLRFFGTNGWYSTKTGSTVCAALDYGEGLIVLDAGEGLYKLAEQKIRAKKVDLFLSHFHLDHIFGLHLLPRLASAKRIEIFGQPGTIKVLDKIIDHPFTASSSDLKGIGLQIRIHELAEGRHEISARKYLVEAAPLKHADTSFGFRFEIAGRIISYCTDTGPCENLVRLAKQADVLITECGMLPGERTDGSWPHLPPEAAAHAAKKADCKKLILTHFAAHLYKDAKSRKAAQESARKIFPATFAAYDGMEIEI